MAIAFCWLFSLCLSLPLVLGFNADTERYLLEEHHCGIYNPSYMFGSSIFAFFLPLLFMSLIYGYIFYTLKRRLRAIQLQEMAGGQFLGFGADLGNIATSAMETVIGIDQKNRNMITWEKPLLKKIEETAAEHASSLNESEREQLQSILQVTSSSVTSRTNDFECFDNKQKRRLCISTWKGKAYICNDILLEDGEEISHAYPSSVILDAVTASEPKFARDSIGCDLTANFANHKANQQPMSINMLEVPKVNAMARRRHSDDGQRRVSVISSSANLGVDARERERRQRRFSLQPPRDNEGNLMEVPNKIVREKGRKKRKMKKRKKEKGKIELKDKLKGKRKENKWKRGSAYASLPAQGNKKSMRRLSELISGWERPSRSSLGQLLAFARRDSVYIARKKLAGLKDWALDLIAKLKSKQGLAIRREARATKLVATVMGVFLICWSPYFSMNLYKIFKLYNGGWSHESEFAFHWLSALGYLNSSLNFFIYSAINKKFRITFWRLLGLRRSQPKKKWTLPPPQNKKKGPKRTNKDKEQQQKQQQMNQSQRENSEGTAGEGKSAKTVKVTKYEDESGQKGEGESRRKRRAKCKSNAGPEEREPTQRQPKRKKRFVSLIPLSRNLSIRKPQIMVEDLANPMPNSMTISAGGDTTYRRSSDDCIQRSCSEVFGGGIVFPSGTHHNSRRGSAMSNSSASLQLHDIHQIEAQSAEEVALSEGKPEVFI